MEASNSAAARCDFDPFGAWTFTFQVSRAPGRSLSRNVEKLTLSSLSSHGTSTDCESVIHWWSRRAESFTEKPPRCFSATGISTNAGETPEESSRRSTRRPAL